MSKPVILLGVSGSIAAVKAPELVRLLIDCDFHVRCVLTKNAEKFVSPLTLATFSAAPVPTDIFNNDAHQFNHLRWAEEATVMLIAPASAPTLSRCAHGLSDDMVSLMYLTTTAPILMAPAMHPTMWAHPATQSNVKILKDRGVSFLGPYQGRLADNTEGDGRMAEPVDLVNAVEALVKKTVKK